MLIQCVCAPSCNYPDKMKSKEASTFHLTNCTHTLIINTNAVNKCSPHIRLLQTCRWSLSVRQRQLAFKYEIHFDGIRANLFPICLDDDNLRNIKFHLLKPQTCTILQFIIISNINFRKLIASCFRPNAS